MSFPYLTDIINAVFHTDLHLPLPTFGLCVAMAIVAAIWIARKEIKRQQTLGALPVNTDDFFENVVVMSILTGLLGARIFSILDYPDEFVREPISMIFSRSGLSIYGGLCFGIATGLLLLKRRAIPLLPMLDATAPAMMLGYAIGRIGCQLSGDGDWGIVANMQIKPEWLPDWFWSQTYQGNIAGVIIPSPGVYPTPVYEIVMALAAFAILWALRSQSNRAGYLFSVYLLLTGFERLLIEKIRINVRLDLFGIAFTQAEFISLFIVLFGLMGVLATVKTRSVVIKGIFAATVLTLLSACAPH
ncbi:MAG TPA: prolipoprotein diacylglyceryl transferase [Steroidobacteraceae bacterium]|nr:prolipoprotein diacylglyceryl transferase [Steroidobacteraceae bacterium]